MNYIDNLKKSMGQLINEKKAHCKNGNIPSASEVFTEYVRLATDDILKLALAEKVAVFGEIKDSIGTAIVNPFCEIQQIDDEIQQMENEIIRFSKGADTYALIKDENSYNTFSLYFQDDKKNKTAKTQENNDSLPFYNEIKETAKKESANIIKKVINAIFCCVIVTLLFIGIDSALLYSPFQNSNLADEKISLILSFITALTLDALPTSLGLLWENIKSSRKLLEIKPINLRTKSDKKDLFHKQILFFVNLIVMIAMFTAYMSARVVLLLGGGDFDTGVHIFLTKDLSEIIENLKEVSFYFTDVLSIFTPVVSSLICLVWSKLISASKSDYIDSFNAKITNTIKIISAKCEEQKAVCINRKEELERTRQKKMYSLWSFYQLNGRPPERMELFAGDVTRAAYTIAINQYKGEYERFCQEARSYTEMQINALKEELAAYCEKPVEILNLPLSESEKKILDSIWNFDGEQTENTNYNINEINRCILEIVNSWDYESTDEYAV